jgi:hypothetical protein
MSQENVERLREIYAAFNASKQIDLELHFPLAHVFRFRGAQVDQWHAYADRREALEAVGPAQ